MSSGRSANKFSLQKTSWKRGELKKGKPLSFKIADIESSAFLAALKILFCACRRASVEKMLAGFCGFIRNRFVFFSSKAPLRDLSGKTAAAEKEEEESVVTATTTASSSSSSSLRLR